MKKAIKRIFLMIGTFFTSIYTKVFAFDPIQPMYGIPAEPDLYGVPRPETIPLIWRIAKGLVIPIALIIGLIIYFKKSKSSKKKKIIMSIISIVIVILLCLLINSLI